MAESEKVPRSFFSMALLRPLGATSNPMHRTPRYHSSSLQPVELYRRHQAEAARSHSVEARELPDPQMHGSH
jgi:hypothetical protein